jgi:DegV family protein with EDD domain
MSAANTPSAAIAYLDAPRLLRALRAGIGHLFERRDYLNRINVFPVPDGDTGTNMAFTFKTILEATRNSPDTRMDELMDHVADAALDGARGNSGAIMAQYFHGFREAIRGSRLLTAQSFAHATTAGAQAAWKAMSQPVAGTLPTVLEDFSNELKRLVDSGVRDIAILMKSGLAKANESLANTPNLLPALKQAGVVDAGGQGFVDLLEGIWTYIESGATADVSAVLDEDHVAARQEFTDTQHRYCTECVVKGEAIDRDELMRRLDALDSSSLVVAGGRERVRVHIHVDNPAEVFLVCEDFGRIRQQKAEDMRQQHGLLDMAGEVAIVTDSAADLPVEERERLGINVVPVRLSFGDREYLDGVSMTSREFYEELARAEELPLTSQPPAQDFGRVYALLTSHGYKVLSLGLSEKLSGTTAAARQAAGKFEEGQVTVLDTLNASGGQGLLAMAAAEAAQEGLSVDEVGALVRDLLTKTRVFAVADRLDSAVKGGRVPAWFKKVADWLRINPVLTASPKGEMSLGGFIHSRHADPARFARKVVRAMQPDGLYRVLVSHANNEAGAQALQHEILTRHGRIHSIHLTAAGPALGVHLGPGGLIAAFMPNPEVPGAKIG